MIGFLHRQVWQRVPRDWRRRASVGVARLALAPALGRRSPDRSVEPVTVAGVLASASGLGEGARLCYRALAADGLAVDGLDLSQVLRAERNVGDFSFRPAREAGAPGSMIVHVNAFPLPLAMMRIGGARLRSKRIVGYFAWELPAPPPIWAEGMRYVDEVWVPSRFTAEALAPILGGRTVRVMPHPIAIDDRFAGAGEAAREPGRPFTVLTVFNMRSSFERKNPLATVEAFRRAFGDTAEARLVVKAVNAGSHPEGWRRLRAAAGEARNIELIDRAVSAREMTALYGAADAVSSLHRAEGFGLLAAEAMLAGLPVVATDFSGTRDFLHPGNALPVPFTLVPARDPQGEYDMPSALWAEPDTAAASDAFRRLFEDEALRRRLGAAARRDALAAFDPRLYAARARAALAA